MAPMAVLNRLVKRSAKAQRSGGRDIFVGRTAIGEIVHTKGASPQSRAHASFGRWSPVRSLPQQTPHVSEIKTGSNILKAFPQTLDRAQGHVERAFFLHDNQDGELICPI
jgi:hypothetical protein